MKIKGIGIVYMGKSKKKKKKNQKMHVKPIGKGVKKIINQLKSSKENRFDAPKEYQNDRNVIGVERNLGMRKLGRRGYDIIRNTFFVEEELTNDGHTKKEITYFDDFESYSAFVDGAIYDNACYYQCDISKIRNCRKINAQTLKPFMIYDHP